ncbi:MAG: TonB-dependent receptor [Bacteroidales bacterium]|nr:TonB-dependent receptor [Bacteroidales bacterium]
MKISLISLILIVVIFTGAIAQPAPEGPGKIMGKVIDNINQIPLEFATISVFGPDSTLINGGITGTDGTFSINIDPGKYYAVIQFISYKKEYLDNIEVSRGSRIVDLGTIELKPEATDLDAVTVVAEKSEMVIALDKKVFNVGKDLSNTGQTTLDILDNIPSVSVDLEGNVSLRGSSNLQILINGKPSGMINAGNSEALQNLQASMVDRVEVITNPSARYEAEGMGGIINIVLKKEQQKGVNGTFETTAGYPHIYSLGANVNFRREKINYFLNYNVRYDERPGGGYGYQERGLTDSAYIKRIHQDRLRTGLSNRIQGGLDYFINSKNIITGSFILGIDNQLNLSELTYKDYTITDTLDYLTLREDKEREDELDIEFTLNYEKIFSGDEHKLTIYSHYIEDEETEDSDISESIEYVPDNEMIREWDLVQRVLNEESERNFLIQVDYIQPLGRSGKFESGYRSEFRKISNPYIVEEKNTIGNWDTLPEYTNNINYIENVHAFYMQAGNKFNKFSVQVGLRGELSDIRISQNESNDSIFTILPVAESANDDLYFNLFPTVHTTYEFNPKHAVQLSYSRRINRPHFWLLNPFYSYTDPKNIRTGNPFLEPEYTNSYEAGYIFKQDYINFYAGLYLRDTKGVIDRITTYFDSLDISIQIPYNLDRRISYGIESNLTLNPFKWWTFTSDINYYRSQTNGTTEGVERESDYYSWNTRLNSKMRFRKLFDLQAIYRYRAPSETTQGKRKAMYMLDLAISRDILKNKGTLTFNIRDVLNSRKYRYVLDEPNIYSEGEWRRSERTYMLTFMYRLNQKKKRPEPDRRGDENGFGGEDIGF